MVTEAGYPRHRSETVTRELRQGCGSRLDTTRWRCSYPEPALTGLSESWAVDGR